MTHDRGIFSSCCSDPEEDFLYVLAYHISCIISSSFPQQFNFLRAYSVCKWLILCVLQWQDFLYSGVALRLKKQKTLLEGKNVISSFTPFVFHQHVFLSVLLMAFSSLRLKFKWKCGKDISRECQKAQPEVTALQCKAPDFHHTGSIAAFRGGCVFLILPKKGLLAHEQGTVAVLALVWLGFCHLALSPKFISMVLGQP